MDKKYTISGNMKYMIGEIMRFNPGSLPALSIGIPAKVLTSVTAIYVPKLVLDAIIKPAAPLEFIITVAIITVILAGTSLLNLISQNAVKHCANAFVLTYLNRKWMEKVTDMDYEAYIMETNRQKAEKARESMGGTARWGVGSYFPRLAVLLTNAAGFVSFGAILVNLHPLVIPLLIISYSVSMLFTIRTEKWKQLSKEDMTRVDRRLNYMAYKTRGLNIGKDIRLYSMQGWLREMADNAKNDKRRLQLKLADRQFILLLINAMLVFLRDGAAYAYLIHMALNGNVTVGGFVLYFAAISGLGEWLARFTAAIGEFTEANNYVTDFRAFMDVPGLMNREGREAIPDPGEAVSIQLENVSFAYNPEAGNVLEGVNLYIKAGEKLAIVGENGAGKTTIVKLVCGLIRAGHGCVRINGVDMERFARDEYYRIFSAVFQDSGVLPVSIADNIALNIGGEKDYERIGECIGLAGLTDKIRSLPSGLETRLVKQISEEGTELSGGETQKLLLARALYKKSSVIILDEPTAALDPIAENEIYLRYDRLTQGKTALFISHRLSSTRFCDRIILIGGKGISESGSHDELMAKNGKYAAMFRIQSQYYKDGGGCFV